jgi:hypothetical protein
MSSVVSRQVMVMSAAEINVRGEQIIIRHQRTAAVIQYKCVDTPVILALVQFLVIIVVTSQLWELLKCYIYIYIYCNELGLFYSRWNFIALQKSIHYS